MQILKRALVTFAILLFVLFAISLLLPAEIHVQRSTEIKAPVSLVFGKVNDLKEWNSWSPWFANDPDMEQEYSPATSGKSAWNKWKSESEGSGKQTITKSILNKVISTHLDFGDQGEATSGWKFEDRADGTVKVTWSMDMEAGWNPIMRFFGLRMDSKIGGDYEIGLANLKKLCEKEVPKGAAADPAP